MKEPRRCDGCREPLPHGGTLVPRKELRTYPPDMPKECLFCDRCYGELINDRTIERKEVKP